MVMRLGYLSYWRPIYFVLEHHRNPIPVLQFSRKSVWSNRSCYHETRFCAKRRFDSPTKWRTVPVFVSGNLFVALTDNVGFHNQKVPKGSKREMVQCPNGESTHLKNTLHLCRTFICSGTSIPLKRGVISISKNILPIYKSKINQL